MITTDRRQIWHPERGFLYINVFSRGFKAGEPATPTETAFEWHEPARAEDWWGSESVDRFLSSPTCPIDRGGIVVLPLAHCPCCGHEDSRWSGEDVELVVSAWDAKERQYRCFKHVGRNPCAIEGCKRTRTAGGRYADDQTLCVEHWRRFVPPRSRKRRLYHAHWRRAKRLGWTPERIRSFNRFWDSLVVDARRRAAAGDIDIAEIERMFGL